MDLLLDKLINAIIITATFIVAFLQSIDCA